MTNYHRFISWHKNDSEKVQWLAKIFYMTTKSDEEKDKKQEKLEYIAPLLFEHVFGDDKINRIIKFREIIWSYDAKQLPVFDNRVVDLYCQRHLVDKDAEYNLVNLERAVPQYGDLIKYYQARINVPWERMMRHSSGGLDRLADCMCVVM